MVRNALLLAMLAGGITACNSGNNAVPTPTPYLPSSMSIIESGAGCTAIGSAGLEVECAAESSTLMLTVTYTAQPASYMVIPTVYPSGVTSSQSGVCSTTPVLSYSCSVTLVANNAESGAVNFYLDGDLGQRNFITVIYQ